MIPMEEASNLPVTGPARNQIINPPVVNEEAVEPNGTVQVSAESDTNNELSGALSAQPTFQDRGLFLPSALVSPTAAVNKDYDFVHKASVPMPASSLN